ncbi:MAG: hypothetical protein JNJ40_01625 [Bacteroidia bacterium]|nr:hypothetical protein [Bacteroidia bacterium]
MNLKTLSFILLLLSLGQLSAQTIDYVISDTAKVGVFKTFQDTSEINYFLKISNKEKENKKFRIYYDDKKKKLASEFNCDSKGLMDTIREWFENGQVKQIYYSKKNGNAELWEGTKYHKNKQLKLSRKCNNDTCVTLMYYDNGKLEAKLQEKGLNLFFLEKYYKNGQKMFDPHKVDWENKVHEILYYENGKILQDRFWFNYSLVDEFKEFHDNGVIKITGQYEAENEYRSILKAGYRNAFKIGKWSYYNKSGELEKEIFYDKDEIIKTINY